MATKSLECPTGSGAMMNLWQVADEFARRGIGIFQRDDRVMRKLQVTSVASLVRLLAHLPALDSRDRMPAM